MHFSSLRPDVRAFLEPPRHATIATHDGDGEIWQAVVWYAIADDRIVMNALAGRRWLENVRRDPRLSMAVADGEDYVILRGVATVVDDPALGLTEAMALARRYGGDPESHRGQHRVRVLFEPERLGFHGNLARPGGR